MRIDVSQTHHMGKVHRAIGVALCSGFLLLLNPGQAAMGATATLQPADPAVGPHAREDARHAGDQLRFTPSTTATLPRQLKPATPLSPGAAVATTGGGPLKREVLGFAPYWALANHQQSGWNYSLLSTVAYFGLNFNADGTFNQTDNGWAGWSSADMTDMMSRARGVGDRVVVVIKAFDNATICSVVYGAAQTAVSSTINAIQSKSLDGVNVDFEGSNTTCPNGQSLQSGLTAFMSMLSSGVHQAVPGSFVTIDTYSGAASWDAGEFKIGDLAPVVDAMFVMAYDMSASNMPGHAGPNAPLNGWTYNDTTSVTQYLSKAPASKIILGVPYYGYKWSTTDAQPYSTTSGAAQVETYGNVAGDLACALQLTESWDGTAASPWASWYSPATNDPCQGNHGSWREMYFDDVNALGQKYDLVNRMDLRGTGMWALGYDGNAPELWSLLQEKFVSWSGWESLGGNLASAPTAASWATGRLDVFARASNNALLHKWYDGSSWHGWESLGGSMTSAPAAVSWAAGRLDVFARGPANDLIHKWYGTNGWSGWESLGGVLGAAPGVSSWTAGRLDVFATGGDRALWHRWYDGGAWHSWESLGGVLTAGPAAASMSAGRVDVFGRGGDRALWHRWYATSGWSGWESLGGILNSGPAATSWGSGRLDVFMRATDNAVWHDTYDANRWNWEYLGGTLTSDPGAATWGVGRLDVFSRGPDLTLWHKWYQAS